LPRIRTTTRGLALFAILALNAIAFTTTASAVEVVLLTELLPVPAIEKPVTFTDKGGTTVITALGAATPEITCEKNTSAGNFTTPKLGKDEIKFEKCKSTTFPCEDLGKTLKEGIVTKGTVHVQTALLTGTQVAAFVFLPEALHFTCGLLLFLILQIPEDPSCFAGQILQPNTLTKTIKVHLIQNPTSAGDQDITEVYNDKDEKYSCKLLFNGNEGKAVDAAIEQIGNEELEGFKLNGAPVEALIMF
jgi:hypothetical protein